MLVRVLHTIRYLKPVQVYSRVYRPRLRPPASEPPSPVRVLAGQWAPAIERPECEIGPGRFRLLNQERQIETWNDAGIPKLWLYNLHYFARPTCEMIQKWIAENPAGEGAGWEPYPLSLRICNWIKWSLAGNALPPTALESLATQARFLSRRLEYHLLGNHLLANAKALVFAGMFFDGSAAREWLSAGLRILNVQIPEQILADGGHFERSPMYHATILEDLLDLINLGRLRPGTVPDWRGTARRMLGWLQQMTHPDGRIAFFNDAAFGVAPEPAALVRYAERLGIRAARVALGPSGYIRLENRRTAVLFDAAPIGPDYQPGHAHADTLSFELSVDGRREIVNSGVSTYDRNADRQAQRSTPAHNTATIDGANSSEVWASFRVARRARPLQVRTDHATFAEAAHDGYGHLKDPVIHRRRLDLDQAGLRVTDWIEAKREHRVELYFHLHPESMVAIVLDPKLMRSEGASFWHPEFNRSEANRTVVGRWKGPCPVQLVTRIPF